jgi:hypothetical protein
VRRRGPRRHAEAVEFAALEWVDWFNNRRLLEPISLIPPAEFEQVYYRGNEPHAMVARLTRETLRGTRGDSIQCIGSVRL